MISGIEIINYQAHKHTYLEFDPGLNIIAGDNANGKSSIIRAIRWVLENRPTGFKFLRWGTDPAEGTTVSIELPGEEYIIRHRDKDENYYLTSISDEEMKALRSEVPEEVSNLLNISPVSYQSQFEKMFLIQSSPGEVAKEINKTVNLEKIAESVTRINRIERDAKYNAEEAERGREEALKSRKKYEALPKIEKKTLLLRTLHEQCEEKETEINNLESSIIAYQSVRKDLEKLNWVEDVLNKLVEADGHIEDYEKYKYYIQKVSDLYNTYVDLKTKLDEIPNISENKIDKAISFYKEMELKERNINNLKEILEELEENITALENILIPNLKKAEEQFEKTLKKAKICPLCGGKTHGKAACNR